MRLPKGYSIEKSEGSTSLFRKGLLVFHSRRPVSQEEIEKVISQIEEAQKKLGAT